MEVIYTGLHQTPEQIAATVIQEDADAVGLSILSGAHMTLGPEGRRAAPRAGRRATSWSRWAGRSPPTTSPELKKLGVAEVFTPAPPPTRSSTSSAARSTSDRTLAGRRRTAPAAQRRLRRSDIVWSDPRARGAGRTLRLLAPRGPVPIAAREAPGCRAGPSVGRCFDRRCRHRGYPVVSIPRSRLHSGTRRRSPGTPPPACDVRHPSANAARSDRGTGGPIDWSVNQTRVG